MNSMSVTLESKTVANVQIITQNLVLSYSVTKLIIRWDQGKFVERNVCITWYSTTFNEIYIQYSYF